MTADPLIHCIAEDMWNATPSHCEVTWDEQFRVWPDTPVTKILLQRAEALVKAIRKCEADLSNTSAMPFPSCGRKVRMQSTDALRELVRLKDYKDQHGKDLHYTASQKVAWDMARAALSCEPVWLDGKLFDAVCEQIERRYRKTETMPVSMMSAH